MHFLDHSLDTFDFEAQICCYSWRYKSRPEDAFYCADANVSSEMIERSGDKWQARRLF